MHHFFSIKDWKEFYGEKFYGRKFKGLTNRGVRIEKASTGGWAMEYGFVGNTEIDLGGFGGLGGAGLTRFYIGGHYTTPIISIQSGSANTNGMIKHV